jgi:hypothetical protein
MTKDDGPTRRAKSSFIEIGKVLDRVVNQLGLDERVREVALFELWPSLVGAKLAEKSRPLFVDHERNVVIAVKDAAVAQELGFLRKDLTEKFRVSGLKTGIKLKGLRFDLRHNFDDWTKR